PPAVNAGYAEAARRRGAVIEQGVEVVSLRTSSGKITGVVTAAGEEISCPVVVNAAGLWSPAVARLADIELPIVIGRHPVFVVERDPGFGPDHMVYMDLAGGSYLRPETGGLTLTGSLIDDETQHPMDPELLGAEPSFDEASVALARPRLDVRSSPGTLLSHDMPCRSILAHRRRHRRHLQRPRLGRRRHGGRQGRQAPDHTQGPLAGRRAGRGDAPRRRGRRRRGGAVGH